MTNTIEDHLDYVIVYATYQTLTYRDSYPSTIILTPVKLATCFLSLFTNTNCFVLDREYKKKREEKEMSTLTNTYVVYVHI